jgi:hypothetical protein
METVEHLKDGSLLRRLGLPPEDRLARWRLARASIGAWFLAG